MDSLKKLIYLITLKQYDSNTKKMSKYNKVYKTNQKALQQELMNELSQTPNVKYINDVDRIMGWITPLIVGTVVSIAEWELKEMNIDLREAFDNTYKDTAEVIASGLKQPMTFKMLADNKIDELLAAEIKGKTYKERIVKNKVKMANKLYDKVRDNVIEGIDIRKLSKDLSKEFNISTYESMRLLQNETSKVINAAQLEVYEESEVVETVGFTATLDDLTTDICQGYDGEEFELGDRDMPNIPEDTHVNCRSCYIPIIENWSPTLRYDNLNKEVIDYVTYEDYEM